MTTEYTDEQAEQMLREIVACDYYPNDISQSDMEDYLAKEKNGEAVFTSAETIDTTGERIKAAEELFMKERAARVNRYSDELGIEPNKEMLRDLNEELALFRIKQYADVVKEMKAEFQVDKFRLYNTFKDKEVLKRYTDEQIKNAVLSAWHTKKGIEEMEKVLRKWEEEEKNNKINDKEE
jgi:hypothetical protein